MAFADVATVRRVLAEAWNVKFVDLTDLLSDMIFLAKILCFFQLSVSKGAGTGSNGHGLVAKCFLCGFQKKRGVYTAGKGYGYASKERRISWSFLYFSSSVILSVAGICSVTS